MAENAPKTAAVREEPGKLASRIEARLNQPVIMGGNPGTARKAPLAPRASQPDLSDLGETMDIAPQNRPPAPSSSGVIDTIEPESFAEDDGADIRRTVRKTSSQNSHPPVEGSARGDFQKALSQLPGQSRLNPVPSSPPSAPSVGGGSNRAPETRRMSEMPLSPVAVSSAGAPRSKAPSIPSVKDLGQNVRPMMGSLNAVTEVLGTPAPNLPPTKSITAMMTSPGIGPSPIAAPGGGPNPNNALGLKPGTGSPLAPIRTPNPMAIVGGSSLRINSPGKSMQPIRPTGPPPPDVFQASPLAPPTAGQSSSPLAFGGKGSMPPSAPSSRPSSMPASNKPVAGGPPVQYERAFRQWSAPALEEQAPPNGPVTFQVYTAQDVATGRRPLRSMPAIDVQPPKKQSLVLKIGLGVLGLIVVALTAAAVIAVSTEDPKKPAATSAAPPPPPPPALPDPAPPPSTITIGDGPDDPASASASAATTTPATPAVPGVKPMTIKRSLPTPPPRDNSSAQPPAPTGLKNIAPPPNPYGK